METALAALTAMVVAQAVKLINFKIRKGKWNFELLKSNGGWPSSHTAVVTALTCTIGFFEGIDNYFFAIAITFSIITIHDAMGVRYEASKHARFLNILSKRIDFEELKEFKSAQLKESLGHTFREVFGGVIVGILVALFFRLLG
ncbi:divergent PAP2 family protein [Mangrovibacterium diazotrophicum]|uniref:Divergent PAP2 family protein n=1 Tax=Mangrovibacterium diazotrophicum TaxID=1261403 RepID=A0A419W544_9BACT|nr:divergent PAP2 family protein [Mangrovibacterium diazotrophicum]RKD90567.1 hypothetical protein BC643_0907 [Mangrovibacterium diazotrophicum]